MSSTMSLYDVSLEGMDIHSLLMENEGELTPELEARLDRLLQDGPQRVEAAAMVVRGIEASAEACKAESRRLSERATSLNNQAQRLKDRITFALDAAFNGKVKTSLFTVWAQSSAPTTSFELDASRPIEAIEAEDSSIVRVKRELNKDRLKDIYRSGDPLPAGIIVTENPGIRYCRIK